MNATQQACDYCGEPISADPDGLGWLDNDGSSVCAAMVDGCGACDDGESHPHWPGP